jgi:hypothetical protein
VEGQVLKGEGADSLTLKWGEKPREYGMVEKSLQREREKFGK